MKNLALITAILLLSANSNAESKTTKKLLEVMRLPQTIKDMRISMIRQQVVSNPNLKIIEKEYGETVKEILNWENLEGPIGKIYEDHYTKSEMEDLIKFYKTPIGKKSIELMPAISAATMLATQKIMTKYRPKLDALQQVYVKKMKEKKKK